MAIIVRFYQTGPAQVLQVENLPQRSPKENEVRLKIQATGLNRAEVMFRTGAYLETPTFSARLGLEAAGTVDAVGAGVTGIEIGERVSTVPSFSMSSHGVLWRGGDCSGSCLGALSLEPLFGRRFCDLDAVPHRLGCARSPWQNQARPERSDHGSEQQCRARGNRSCKSPRREAHCGNPHVREEKSASRRRCSPGGRKR